MGSVSDVLKVHSVSGQNIADWLSHLTKIPASPCDGVTEEYVTMVAVSPTPRAMTTKEIAIWLIEGARYSWTRKTGKLLLPSR